MKNTMIINSVFIRLASLSETAIADIVSFYGTEALKPYLPPVFAVEVIEL